MVKTVRLLLLGFSFYLMFSCVLAQNKTLRYDFKTKPTEYVAPDSDEGKLKWNAEKGWLEFESAEYVPARFVLKDSVNFPVKVMAKFGWIKPSEFPSVQIRLANEKEGSYISLGIGGKDSEIAIEVNENYRETESVVYPASDNMQLKKMKDFTLQIKIENSEAHFYLNDTFLKKVKLSPLFKNFNAVTLERSGPGGKFYADDLTIEKLN